FPAAQPPGPGNPVVRDDRRRAAACPVIRAGQDRSRFADAVPLRSADAPGQVFPALAEAVRGRMKPGDYLLCYLTRVSRWVGVLEVTGEPLFDGAPIWSSRVFPNRVRVRVVLAVRPEHGGSGA